MKKLLLICAVLVFSINMYAQSWSLTGNSGTTPGTNFLGTKDANALVFKVNNQQAGIVDYVAGKANTTFGFQAFKTNTTGSNNVAVGYKTSFSNTTGKYNVSAGAYALYFNTTGYSNVAMGIGAMYKNATNSNLVAIGDSALYNNAGGTLNTAVGSKSLYANTSGGSNSALGFFALYNNTTGSYNSAFGTNALVLNNTGSYNTSTGYQSMYLNTSGTQNTAMGYQALYRSTASLNTGVGYRALYTNTTGSFNTASGTFSMYNNSTGYSNTAYGYSSLNGNTTGYYNTAVGSVCLFLNTTGSYNTSTGHYALYNNSSGFDNDAHGEEALYNNTTGYLNVGLGVSSLYNNTYGGGNTAVGANALYGNTGSYYNTAVGYLALAYAGTPGYNNVAIGAFSGPDVNTDGVYNSVAVGEGCYTSASNQARIGNSSTTSIGGYVGWSNISDGRVKQHIKQNVPGLAFINKLNPVTYNLSIDAINRFIPSNKKDKDGKLLALTNEETASLKAKEQVLYTGFIAQDVEKAAKSLSYDFSGVDAPKNDKDLYGLRYAEFVVPLVKAVQELSKKNDEKDSVINTLEERLTRLESLMNVSAKSVSGNQITSVSSASLSQNNPNPFISSTSIGYSLPASYSSAKIIVTDKNGNALKQVNLTGSKGSITIDASTLSSGAYQYTLYVDGRIIDSRQMILSK